MTLIISQFSGLKFLIIYIMGLSGDGNYARYHLVLDRAAWSPLSPPM